MNSADQAPQPGLGQGPLLAAWFSLVAPPLVVGITWLALFATRIPWNETWLRLLATVLTVFFLCTFLCGLNSLLRISRVLARQRYALAGWFNLAALPLAAVLTMFAVEVSLVRQVSRFGVSPFGWFVITLAVFFAATFLSGLVISIFDVRRRRLLAIVPAALMGMATSGILFIVAAFLAHTAWTGRDFWGFP